MVHGCKVIKLIHVNIIVLQYKELIFNLFSSYKKGLICGAKGSHISATCSFTVAVALSG